MADSSKIGASLACVICGSQVIVVKPSGSVFTCCDDSPLAAPNVKERHVGSR